MFCMDVYSDETDLPGKQFFIMLCFKAEWRGMRVTAF